MVFLGSPAARSVSPWQPKWRSFAPAWRPSLQRCARVPWAQVGDPNVGIFLLRLERLHRYSRLQLTLYIYIYICSGCLFVFFFFLKMVSRCSEVMVVLRCFNMFMWWFRWTFLSMVWEWMIKKWLQRFLDVNTWPSICKLLLRSTNTESVSINTG